MSWNHLLAIATVMTIACSSPGGEDSRSDTPVFTGRYQELYESGERHLESGELDAARAAFESAAKEILVEVPNFEVLVKLSEAMCLQGDTPEGAAILSDFKCMLTVYSGELKCFAEGARNPKLSPDCFERMCSEVYLSYYERPTEKQLERVALLRKEAVRVSEICGEEPAK